MTIIIIITMIIKFTRMNSCLDTIQQVLLGNGLYNNVLQLSRDVRG